MANPKSNKQIKIIETWCKGCGICVEFCPVNVLKLIDDKITITDKDKCIRCGLCELRCPDYAIYLEEDKDEK
ncbi:2-oxoglutarate ferredoxin oxidoreductase subunit delta [Natronincola peptidivorans]|uniref:2-oxoglutarate ferredoxin oxidoreductase subunit delta n=1 Tax=Natronincola peptidivorans TaxID=426128 RepID=A0A1H9YJM8_9FIRM|nr:4Fe-4S binding protein [Natronincola peptidivorans]SES69249.1 2-oxoglutarate ferredoxin oxidoreductase subunit delta [Natronincola peptidivorans]